MSFDINKHEWSDSSIGRVVVDDCNLIIEDFDWDISSISINKQDATAIFKHLGDKEQAIAIAKHFGLTSDYLKDE